MTTPHHETSAHLLSAVRAAHGRTMALTEDLDDEEFCVPLVENLNPFLWELGHVAFFYELFLLRELDGGELLFENGNELYNSFDVPHSERWELGLPDRQATCDYVQTIMSRVIERAEGRELSRNERYLYRLAINHENMHQEAFTYMRHFAGMRAPSVVTEGLAVARPEGGDLPGDVEVPGGVYQLGAPSNSEFAYDNEKWEHEVEVDAFRIARAPVTAAEFAAFVEADGYEREELWSSAGWRWRNETSARHPVGWARDGGGWSRRHFDQRVPLEPHHPVVHVCWHEAEAYCRWAQRRLPTEAEWELAASGTRGSSEASFAKEKRRFAWGNSESHDLITNGSSRFGGCVDVAAFPDGDSAFGCRQMLGNVWEWTASDFYPFPGYLLDQPYKEYSAPWFGDRKVLRGGCWATQPSLAYNVYRNFFEPHRTDIYAGFRTCAL